MFYCKDTLESDAFEKFYELLYDTLNHSRHSSLIALVNPQSHNPKKQKFEF
jgi:hypothetical protein